MSGMLYLVPTPIGNLGDISPRMAEALAQADFIAAEDTRVSVKLLNHLGIKKPMVSYYRHNTSTSGPAMRGRAAPWSPTRAPRPSPTPGRNWWPCAPRRGWRWCPSPGPAPWWPPWRPRASPPGASPLRAFWP